MNRHSDIIEVVRRKIHIRGNIHFLDKINTNKQEFLCKVRITSSWFINQNNPYYAKALSSLVCNIDATKIWTPKLFFTNIIKTFKEDTYYKLELIDNKPVIIENKSILGIFNGAFKLVQFPFDTQELSISLQSHHNMRNVIFLPFGYKFNKLAATETFVENNEWYLDNRITSIVSQTSAQHSSSSSEYPQIKFGFQLKRKTGFYLWNIIFIHFLMCLASFSTFSLDQDNIGDKLNVSFMTLLTVIAFKFATTQLLPQVSYLTLLDKYIIWCILFHILVIVQNSLYTFIDFDYYERYSMVGLGGFLLAFNSYFCYIARST